MAIDIGKSYTDLIADVNAKLDKTAKATDADKLDGQDGSYYLNYKNLSNKPTIPTVDTALSSTSTNPVQNKVVDSALGKKLSLSGGTMNDGATIKLSTFGNRFVTISGNSIAADMSKETGGWAGSFASVKDPSGTTTTMLGWYGSASGLNHIFMGGTYSDPSLKMTPAGQFTFKNTPKVGSTNVSLEGHTHSAYATLDSGGKVPASQLPSYVDDVLEYSAKSSFPATGETGKIYVDTSTNITYRWSGSAYVAIGSDLALGETSATAYRGDRGKTAYDHSQKTSGNPHGVTKSDVGLGSVENKSSATIRGEITKANVTSALGYTPPTTNTTYSNATTSAAGLMSAADKVKLDNIKTLASVTEDSSGNVVVAKDLTVNGVGHFGNDIEVAGNITANAVTTEDDISVTKGYSVKFYNEDNSKSVDLYCNENGKLWMSDGGVVTTVTDVTERLKDYLPLSGGTMTGAITLPENTLSALYSVRSGWQASQWHTSTGDEAMIFQQQNPRQSWIFRYGTDTTPFTEITPSMQIKNGGVAINKMFATGNTAPITYNLDVNGTANATTIYENGTALSSKYAGTSAATQSAAGLMSAADKKKLDGVATGANNYTYTLPAATSTTLGGIKVSLLDTTLTITTS